MTNFRLLKIFVTVVECGGMRKAAEQLYISQPSVSQAISELEDAYQVRLFDRLSKRIYITEAGKLLLSYAKPILESMEIMNESMRTSLTNPILRIGGSVTVGTVFLDPLVTQLEKHIPGVDIRVTVDNTSNIEDLVLTSKLDFGIIEGTLTQEELIQKTVYQDEIVMVVGKEHPFYSRKDLSLEDLQGEALISRESGSSDRNQFEQLMAEKNIHMVRKWRCTNTETIKKAAISGRGIAILSRCLIQNELSEDLLYVLPLENTKVFRDFRLIYHKNKVLPESILPILTSELFV